MFEKINLFGKKKKEAFKQPEKKGTANINKHKCCYCGACVAVCPIETGALELIETWIKVNINVCIGCGICVNICPVGAIEIINTV